MLMSRAYTERGRREHERIFNEKSGTGTERVIRSARPDKRLPENKETQKE